MVWNINGLKSKIKNSEFQSFCQSSDIIGLIETFCIHEQETTFLDNYTVFHSPAIRRNIRGRPSGGVAIYIKNTIVGKVTRLSCELENCIFVRFNKSVFSLDKNVIFGCCYVRPDHASNFIDRLNEKLTEYCAGNSIVILCYQVILTPELAHWQIIFLTIQLHIYQLIIMLILVIVSTCLDLLRIK